MVFVEIGLVSLEPLAFFFNAFTNVRNVQTGVFLRIKRYINDVIPADACVVVSLSYETIFAYFFFQFFFV